MKLNSLEELGVWQDDEYKDILKSAVDRFTFDIYEYSQNIKNFNSDYFDDVNKIDYLNRYLDDYYGIWVYEGVSDTEGEYFISFETALNNKIYFYKVGFTRRPSSKVQHRCFKYIIK